MLWIDSVIGSDRREMGFSQVAYAFYIERFLKEKLPKNMTTIFMQGYCLYKINQINNNCRNIIYFEEYLQNELERLGYEILSYDRFCEEYIFNEDYITKLLGKELYEKLNSINQY